MGKNKKADMTIKAIIGWVVLIISLVIILAFIFMYPWGGQITSDTCHTTIVLRATANFKFIHQWDFAEDIPLKCQTQKICLGGGLLSSCSDMKASFLGNNVQNMPGKTKDDILNSIADQMYADFSMTGKGLINFMPKTLLKNNYCLITSRIAVSDPKNMPLITYGDLLNKLQQKTDANGISYLKAMYGVNDISQLKNLPSATSSNILNSPINFTKSDQMIAVMIVNPTNWALFGGGGVAGGVLVASYFIPGVGIVTALVSAGAAAVFTISQTESDKNLNFHYTPPMIYPYTPETITGLKCDSIETLA
jgi:hypothetical protein